MLAATIHGETAILQLGGVIRHLDAVLFAQFTRLESGRVEFQQQLSYIVQLVAVLVDHVA